MFSVISLNFQLKSVNKITKNVHFTQPYCTQFRYFPIVNVYTRDKTFLIAKRLIAFLCFFLNVYAVNHSIIDYRSKGRMKEGRGGQLKPFTFTFSPYERQQLFLHLSYDRFRFDRSSISEKYSCGYENSTWDGSDYFCFLSVSEKELVVKSNTIYYFISLKL